MTARGCCRVKIMTNTFFQLNVLLSNLLPPLCNLAHPDVDANVDQNTDTSSSMSGSSSRSIEASEDTANNNNC